VKVDPEKASELVTQFNEFRKQPTLDLAVVGDAEDEMISIARSVRKKRGNWWQVPKMPDPIDDN
jgi:hypothetical protein